MKIRLSHAAIALIMGVTASGAARAQSPAYRYSGAHAGGPVDALIPNGNPKPVVRPVRSPAYRYSGPHAGGPADGLRY